MEFYKLFVFLSYVKFVKYFIKVTNNFDKRFYQSYK